MNDTIATLAAAQHGLFTTRQAAAVGLDDRDLIRMTRAGRCRRLTYGVYVTRQADPLTQGAGLPPHERRLAEHAILARAVLMRLPDAALAGESALVAHDLPVWRVSRTSAHVVRPVPKQQRSANLVTDPWDERVCETRLGPAVAAEVAIAQVARRRGILAGVVAADAALHSGVVTLADVRAEVVRGRAWPGGSQAVAMIDFLDGKAESPGESLARVYLMMAGYPVESQVAVTDARGRTVARIDLRISGTRVAIEFDGAMKYASGDAEVLWAEKRREDRLRAQGWRIVRPSWSDVREPRRLLEMVAAALRHAA